MVVPYNVEHIYLSYDLAVLLLGIYPREVKTLIHTEMCTEMFIAALSQLKPGSNPKVHQLVKG